MSRELTSNKDIVSESKCCFGWKAWEDMTTTSLIAFPFQSSATTKHWYRRIYYYLDEIFNIWMASKIHPSMESCIKVKNMERLHWWTKGIVLACITITIVFTYIAPTWQYFGFFCYTKWILILIVICQSEVSIHWTEN